MGEALLSGSALAAFLAGFVAFFAPCCAMVMLPSYLAGAAGAARARLAALTAIFILGVATVVLPLTVGAAGLAALISDAHGPLFVIGGSIMLVVAWATLRGWMWTMPSFGGGRTSTGILGVYSLGLVSGAATACCAPVMAGAVAIAGVTASWWAGAVLGTIYLLGLVTPLIITAFGVDRARARMRDPQVAVALLGHKLRTSAFRLGAAGIFTAVGATMIVLALLGQAETAPAAQEAFGRWLTSLANAVAEAVPTWAGWLVVAALAAALIGGLRSLRDPTGGRDVPQS